MLYMDEAFANFMSAFRDCYPELKGTDTQIAALLRDALEIVDPENGVACEDAEMLMREFDAIAARRGDDQDYPEDDDDADEA